MKLVDIKFCESDGIARVLEPVRVGVPFARGVVADVVGLKLLDGSAELLMDAAVTQRWPDGSVRWCLLDFQVSVGADAKKVFNLELDSSKSGKTRNLFKVLDAETGDDFQLDSGQVKFSVSATSIGVRQVGTGKARLESPILTLPDGTLATAQVERAEWSSRESCVRLAFTQVGEFLDSKGKAVCRFETVVCFHANSTQVNWQLSIHNPHAAVHSEGLWDLGDPRSFSFQELSVPLRDEGDAVQLQIEANSEWNDAKQQLKLYQASSGGEQWNSRNHADSASQVTLPFRGYRLSYDDKANSGHRASPLVCLQSGMGVYIDRFWQNFPKAIEFGPDGLSLMLFPAQESSSHELQAGERKTHRIRFDFASDLDSVLRLRASPLLAELPSEYVSEAECCHHYTAVKEPVDRLIQQGLDSEHGFEAKREMIDEYGWRNFGDIFADHESLYLPEGELFISHYNNQYDPLYGFLRQFLRSGDKKWMNMANELAWHIVDIDIYSTVEDRAEYNGGLFWHTDHYVDAHTASHRTYSRQQKPNGHDVTQGGGPGAEHCYTHGLMLHYFLTGSAQSRHAVLQLTNWITHFYEGTGTFVESLLDFKGRVLPRVRHSKGSGKVLNHKYPLNRGVGNYVNSLLDSFAITGDGDYLLRAERVICKTISPLDNIEDRNLEDVEVTWFYTILLQSVARFLEVKKQYGESGTSGYRNTLSAFMKYADWMAKNEQPYLRKPDILDFPNDTWVAQDIRKACILFYASSYSSDAEEKSLLTSKAEYFYSYVCNALEESKTSHFSRILSILMQNHGVRGCFTSKPSAEGELDPILDDETLTNPYQSRADILFSSLWLCMKTLFTLSVRKELDWLRHRHSGFARLYFKLYGAGDGKGQL